MEFFPLTLGIPKPRVGHGENRERGSGTPRPTYEAWREGLSGLEEDFDAYPAQDVLSRLMRGDPALPPRPWVILGEPGAGKTSLLAHWHATWLRVLPRPQLGMRVPVPVRLRDVPRAALTGDPAAAADAFWERGLAAGQGEARGTAAAAVFGLSCPRVFTPVWLLDGLDELAEPSMSDAGLWDVLRALPGEAVLTCRTAVFQPARVEIAGRLGKEWRILGLRPEAEQAEFLALAYTTNRRNPARAAGVVRALNANAALRPLAAVPLMLRLVAELGPHPTLPSTRAEFYEDATNAIWERRLRGRPELFDLVPERDAALAALAAAMNLTTLDAGPEELRRAHVAPALREALRGSGLLHFDDRRVRVSFPHLTFQEYHLARAWLGRPFGEMLRERWANPRYEETLALLIALHVKQGQASMVEAELRGFVAKARADHARNPQRLWSLGRSPLRTALHLLSRTASPEITLPVPLFGEHLRTRLAITFDHRAPSAALAELAGDESLWVRRQVARNAATPPALLAELAGDGDSRVRKWVAGNAATPPASLAELAVDADVEVRKWVARNVATLPATVAGLVDDADTGVREWLASNVATAPAILAELAGDKDSEVRVEAARNAATPQATLAKLAGDLDLDVRAGVAWNAATSPATLTELAGDEEKWVRALVAGNAATPPAALVELAGDGDSEVRGRSATNAATPQATLAKLAGDEEEWVRGRSAGNAATPQAILVKLADDGAWFVRGVVAGNAATVPAILIKLAGDEEKWVRAKVAENTATPPEVLAELASDEDPEVRVGVAWNVATPPEVLAELATDGDQEVRGWVAENAATPPAALAGLVGDKDQKVWWKAVSNTALLLEDLPVGLRQSLRHALKSCWHPLGLWRSIRG